MRKKIYSKGIGQIKKFLFMCALYLYSMARSKLVSRHGYICIVQVQYKYNIYSYVYHAVSAAIIIIRGFWAFA